MKKLAFYLTLLLILKASFAQEKKSKVLIVGWDGVLVEAFEQLRTQNQIPVIDSLMNIGLWSTDSWNMNKTISGPSWSSIMNGVYQDKHGITSNDYSGANFAQYPYFPKRVKECNPDLYAVQIITWNPMGVAGMNQGGYITNSGFDESIDVGEYGLGLVTQQALIELQNPDLDVLFLHYDEPDAAGHSGMFVVSNNAYMQSIIDVDNQLGQVIQGVKNRPTYADEEWVIMVITDHGGILFSHGGCTDAERNIWMVFQGARVPENVRVQGTDPGSLEFWCFNSANWSLLPYVCGLTDIAITSIDALLLDTQCDFEQKKTQWDLVGNSWLDHSTYAPFDEAVEEHLNIFPNPNIGEFVTILSCNKSNKALTEVFNVNGQIVFSSEMSLQKDGKFRSMIDISGIEAGTYILKVTTDETEYSRKVIKQ
jgi:hypothetical protein